MHTPTHHRGFWTPEHRRSLYEGIALLVVAIVIQIFAGHFSSRASLNAHWVHDILLDNLPVVNLAFMIVGGAIALWVLASCIMIAKPRYLLFGIKAIAFFIISRAFFFSLTHVGAYPIGMPPGPDNVGWGFYKLITFQGNFFYSGHTAFPFLMALILWDDKFWRYFFLVMTVVFAASVLLAHVHYSIDVFAAPFIIYGMFILAGKAFPKDYALLPQKNREDLVLPSRV